MTRYMVSAEITAASSVERAYAVATDIELIPRYERGISRIEVIREISASERLVRTTLNVFGVPMRFVYRYRYSPHKRYSGVQEEGPIVRGFFSFSFAPTAGGTRIVHREGIVSRWAFVARLVGWLYFRVPGRNGLQSELVRLSQLIEAPDTSGH
jgi:hypothetical protein